MKTKRDIEKLVGKEIKSVRTDVLGRTEIVIGDDILTIKNDLGSTELDLNDEFLSVFTYIDINEWNDILKAFPEITINGTELHSSSEAQEQGRWIHAKWSEDKGLLFNIEDVLSFDGKNVILHGCSPVEETTGDEWQCI